MKLKFIILSIFTFAIFKVNASTLDTVKIKSILFGLLRTYDLNSNPIPENKMMNMEILTATFYKIKSSEELNSDTTIQHIFATKNERVILNKLIDIYYLKNYNVLFNKEEKKISFFNTSKQNALGIIEKLNLQKSMLIKFSDSIALIEEKDINTLYFRFPKKNNANNIQSLILKGNLKDGVLIYSKAEFYPNENKINNVEYYYKTNFSNINNQYFNITLENTNEQIKDIKSSYYNYIIKDYRK